MRNAAGVCALIALTLAPAAFAAARPRAPFAVAAVFPPWWSQTKIDSVSGKLGAVAGRGAVRNIVILYGDADLASAAMRAGAFAVLDPTLAGVCRST